MRIDSFTPCRRLQPLLASHADGQASPEEAAAVEAHVAACETCQRWLNGQRAVRGLLRARAAALRAGGEAAGGVAPIGMAVAAPRRLRWRTAVVGGAMAASLLLAGGVLWRAARPQSLSAIGFINDSRCKTVKTDDPTCARACVDERHAEYVFVSNGVVYPIVNQGFNGLAEFAARAVRLAGSLDGERVRVTRIDLAE
jgi:anti-sigma factor RsiW